MKIHENIFLGDGIKKADKYLNKISTGKLIKKFFVIVFAESKDTLEIYPSYNFLQKYYRNKAFEIVAFTKEESTALEYIRKLSEISVRNYGDFLARKTIDNLTDEDIEFLYRTVEEEEAE